MAQFDTVTNIVADVGAELGLGTLTAVYPATTADVALMQALLKSTGRALLQRHRWLQNVISTTFTMTGATTQDMPADFDGLVDGTGWNRTTRQPLLPVTPARWEGMKASGVSISFPAVCRAIFGANAGATDYIPRLEFLVAPANGDVIAVEYRSRYWLSASASAAATKDAPTSASDIVRIDAHLFTRALKLAWLRQGGFDSTAAQGDFEDALAATRSNNASASPALYMGRQMSYPLLGWGNAPETGYGA